MPAWVPNRSARRSRQNVRGKAADVELLAKRAHLGIARVPDVRVVRPDDRLRPIPARFEDMDEGLEPMGVAQIEDSRRHNT